MKTITHENEIYVLKTDMESAIKDRISKVTSRATDAEAKILAMKSELEGANSKGSNAEALSLTIAELKGQIASNENRFSRYQAISKYGLGADPDMVAAIEWTYDRKMGDINEGDRPDLDTWLSSQIQDPNSAPALLRPHLSKIGSPQGLIQQTPKAPSPSTPPQPLARPPNVNQGAMMPPNQANLIKQGLADPDFYAANRDAIKKQFQALTGGKR